MEKIIHFLKRLGVLAILLAIGSVLYLNFFDYSKSFRVGVPIELSKKGFIFKTYEGTLNIANPVNPPDSTSHATWNFTVKKSADSVVTKLDKAIMEGKRVKLLYVEKIVSLSWYGDTKYLVYDVQILE